MLGTTELGLCFRVTEVLKVTFSNPFKRITRLFKCTSAHANEVDFLFRTFLNHALRRALKLQFAHFGGPQNTLFDFAKIFTHL